MCRRSILFLNPGLFADSLAGGNNRYVRAIVFFTLVLNFSLTQGIQGMVLAHSHMQSRDDEPYRAGVPEYCLPLHVRLRKF